jgi:Ni,Fe-hydrogenase maturation factor
MKIFCFGNEYIEGDEFAKILANKIKKYKNFEFIIAESPNEILNINKNLWILDVVKNIKTTTLIQNPKDLTLPHSLTCHDLDLGFYIKLMTATGKIKNINIIGLPFGEKNIEKMEKEVLEILKKV